MFKYRKVKRSRRKRGSIIRALLSPESSGRIGGRLPRSGIHITGGIVHGPKCLVKRHTVTSKTTSSRSFSSSIKETGKLTRKGILTAAGDRDEEKANAPGNAGDRGCRPLPATETGSHTSWCNARPRLQVILHEKTYI